MCVKGILTSDEIITKWKKFLLKMHDPPNSMNKITCAVSLFQASPFHLITAVN